MMKMVRWLLPGFVLGVLLALSPSCGTKPACGPANCSGCCDATGLCQPGSGSQFCGISGGACLTCNFNESCTLGRCTGFGGVGGGSGGGSGGGTGGGVGGGAGGGGGTAATCNPACGSNQCCQFNSNTGNFACVNAGTALACKGAGGACEVCSGNATCGASGCRDTTCSGCVQGNGQCLQTANQSVTACGTAARTAVRALRTRPAPTACARSCPATLRRARRAAAMAAASAAALRGDVRQQRRHLRELRHGLVQRERRLPGFATCNSSTCPNGCCTSAGTCSTPSNSACGAAVRPAWRVARARACSGRRLPDDGRGDGRHAVHQHQPVQLAGAGAVCKLTTASGAQPYAGGFCTMPCSTDSTCSSATAGAICGAVPNGLQSYGETASLCWPSCGPIWTSPRGLRLFLWRHRPHEDRLLDRPAGAGRSDRQGVHDGDPVRSAAAHQFLPAAGAARWR